MNKIIDTGKVWIFDRHHKTGIYYPRQVYLVSVIEAGIEHFNSKELAQSKCDLLNCI